MTRAGEPGTAGLQTVITTFARDHRLPSIAAALVDGRGEPWRFAYGFADPESGIEAGPETIYRIGSITKTVTATAVMQLRDAGALRLDDPLVAHVGEFERTTNPFGPIEAVTIRRLLSHTAGLPVENPLFDWEARSFPTTDQIVANLDRVTLAVTPETEVKYSNLGYQLLGALVGRVSGLGYRDYVREKILEPMRMDATCFSLPEDLASRVAQGHEPPAFSDRLSPSPDRMKGTDADGGLFSTVGDLAHWVALQFETQAQHAGGAQILAGPTLAEMHRPGRILDARWTQAMGLGWRIYRRDGDIHVGHAGGTFGFTGMVLFSHAHRSGVAVLSNGEAPLSELAARLLHAATVSDENPAASTPAPTIATVPPPVPDPYVELLGLYAWEDHSAPARVEWRDGALALSSFDGRRSTDHSVLEPTDDPLTFITRGGRGNGEPCVFRRGASGAISGLAIGGWPLVRLISAE